LTDIIIREQGGTLRRKRKKYYMIKRKVRGMAAFAFEKLAMFEQF
jgi:hypothetical protein